MAYLITVIDVSACIVGLYFVILAMLRREQIAVETLKKIADELHDASE